jgi:5'-3' exonuclease
LKYKSLIVDGSNLAFRCLPYTDPNENIIPQVVAKFIKTLKTLEAEFCYKNSEHTVYILFDNPTSALELRKTISNGEYKSKRDPNAVPKGFYNSITRVIEVLKCYSSTYKIVQLKTSEADDLTLPLIKHLNPDKSSRVLCISSDLDFSRNIDTFVDWYNFRDTFDIVSFKDAYKFNPQGRKVIMFKALKGDETDNIPNLLPHVPAAIVLELINKYDNMKSLLNDVFNMNIDMKYKKLIKENERRLEINEQLVDFVPIECDITDIIVECKEDLNSLRWHYRNLGIRLEERMDNGEDKDRRFFTKKLVLRDYQKENRGK